MTSMPREKHGSNEPVKKAILIIESISHHEVQQHVNLAKKSGQLLRASQF